MLDQVRAWKLDDAWKDFEAWNQAMQSKPQASADRDPWPTRFTAIDQLALQAQATTRRLFLVRLAFPSISSLACLAIGTFGLAKLNRTADPRYLSSRALAEARFRNAADDTRAALKRADPQDAHKVLRELGDLAMRENSEWLGLHLDRPPNPEI